VTKRRIRERMQAEILERLRRKRNRERQSEPNPERVKEGEARRRIEELEDERRIREATEWLSL